MVFVNIDGRTGYKYAATCSADMTDVMLLKALAGSRCFRACLEDVDMSLCRVYVMGHTTPADGAPLVNLLEADATPASLAGEGDVYLYVETAAAIPALAAGGESACRWARLEPYRAESLLQLSVVPAVAVYIVERCLCRPPSTLASAI